jgi:uncharacterized membrane protein YuzA (DUF378 family)
MKLHKIAFILLIIGGLDWLLVAFGYGIDTWGISASILKIIYILVGLSAIYEVFTHKQNCKACDMKDMKNGQM